MSPPPALFRKGDRDAFGLSVPQFGCIMIWNSWIEPAPLGFIIACCFGFVVPAYACQQDLPPAEVESLWSQENLPKYAVWRYGATDRNQNAIGIFDIRFSHNGKLLAARDRRQNIRVLDLEKRRLQTVIPTTIVKDLIFCPGDKFIAVGKRRETEIWNVQSGELERELKQPGYKLAATANPAHLFIAGKGKMDRLSWPLPSTTKPFLTSLSGQSIRPIGISNSGSMVAFRNAGQVEVLDAESGDSFQFQNGTSSQILIAPDGQLVADLKYGTNTMVLADLRNPKKYSWELKDQQRFVTATFSKDSRFLYSSNFENEIVIWDLVTMKEFHRFKAHNARINALATPDEMFCLASGASGASDRSVVYWNFRELILPKLQEARDFDFTESWQQLGSDDPRIALSATSKLYYAAVENAQFRRDIEAKIDSGNDLENGKNWRRLINRLDDKEFAVRESATKKILIGGPELKEFLSSEIENASQEAKWRMMRLLTDSKNKAEISFFAGRLKRRNELLQDLLQRKIQSSKSNRR